MESLLGIGLTNAVTAALLALAAAVIARFTRRPALWYALWLVVLLRLVAPPLLAVDVTIPDFGAVADTLPTTAVAVSGGMTALDDAGFEIDPTLLLGALWLAGSLVVVGFAAAQSFHLRQILIASEPARVGVTRRVKELASRLGLRRPPAIVEVADRVPPMLWAFLGSVRLILPIELLQRLTPEQTETLLAHELAHLSRRDHWVRHLELAALALFWWNPVAWWATRRVRRAQELCCDQWVAELLPDHRRAYADTLVETARFLSGRRVPVGSPARAMADLEQMKGRIRMIMSDNRTGRLSSPSRLVAAAVLLGVLAVTPILTATPDEPEFTGEPISLRLEEAELSDVLATFSKVTGIEILVEPGIEGTVTTAVHEVPWDQALAEILEAQGLEWEHIGERIIVRRDGARGERLMQPPPKTAPKVEAETSTVPRYIEGGPIDPPKVREKLPPKYPPEMRKERISGAVIAELVIDESGAVRNVEVKESPSPELGAAATEAIEQWSFEPATMNGEPVAVRYIVTVMFRLE
jgi:TonB family protein